MPELGSADAATERGVEIANGGVHPLQAAATASVSMALPGTTIANDVISARLGLGDGWIETRTGVCERRIGGSEDRLNRLATPAARRALERAGVDGEDLGLVLVATMAPDELTPNAATLVATALGAHHAAAFDVGAASTGFVVGLAVACAHVEAGRARNVLVVGAVFLSRLTGAGVVRWA